MEQKTGGHVGRQRANRERAWNVVVAVIVTIIILSRRSYASLDQMFCLDEEGGKSREEEREGEGEEEESGGTESE